MVIFRGSRIGGSPFTRFWILELVLPALLTLVTSRSAMPGVM